MAVSATGDSGLASVMSIYYEKLGLSRLLPNLVLYNLAEKKPITKNSGKTVIFHRYFSFSNTVSALSLTEGTAPTAGLISATPVSATLAAYGMTVAVTDLLELTAVSDVIKDAVELAGENAANIVDRKILEVAYGTSAGTDTPPSGAGFPIIYGNDGSTIGKLSTLTSAHSMTAAGIRFYVSEMRRLNVAPLEDGYYGLVVHPTTAKSIEGDTTWQAAYQYTSPENLRKGEIGKIFGVKVYETSNIVMTASGTGNANTTSAYGSVLLGKSSLGVTEVDGQFRVYVVPRTAMDHANPLQQYSTIGWKVTFVPAILNASCGRIVLTADNGA